MERPEVLCLSGSMRFYPLMLYVAEQETTAGKVVLMPFVTVLDDQQDGETKRMLDELHRAKIRMSDRIIVVSDETGYYGESTSREIRYAGELGLPVEHRCVSTPVPADEARHVIEIRDDGWTIMHPLSCRPNLFECEVNRAAGSALTTPPMEPGRYLIELRDDGLFINDMPVQGTPYRDAGAAEDEAAVERMARALHRGAWERDIANGTPLEGNDVDSCWSKVGAKYREWYYADARAALAALRGEQG